MAGQFASVRLPSVPPCSQPPRLGGRLSRTQLFHTQIFVRTTVLTVFHATFSYTTLSRSYATTSQVPHRRTQPLHTHTHAIVSHSYIMMFSHTNHSFTTFCNYRSSTTSFVFPPFPAPLQLLFLILADDLWGYRVFQFLPIYLSFLK